MDAPETDTSVKERVREQAGYFNISQADVLKAGESAKQFTAERLKHPFTVMTRWQPAGGRGRLPRYYAQTDVGGRDLGEWLVTFGWARGKGTPAILPDKKPAREHMAKLKNLEAEAKARHVGLWAK